MVLELNFILLVYNVYNLRCWHLVCALLPPPGRLCFWSCWLVYLWITWMGGKVNLTYLYGRLLYDVIVSKLLSTVTGPTHLYHYEGIYHI